MGLTPARVAAATEAWVWVPDGATQHGGEDHLLVRFPDFFDHPLELVRFRPAAAGSPAGLAAAVETVLEQARGLDVDQVTWHVALDSPPGAEELVIAHGGVLEETTDVLALDLAGGVPDLGADFATNGLETRWASDPATMRDSRVVIAAAFGSSLPPEAVIAADAAQNALTVAAGSGGGVVAYAGDRPVGTGGVTVAGDVARLWSGSVLEAHRGRGAYRAVLDARLRFGVEHGATMALVKGRVDTSAPILRRAGFVAFGQQRSYAVPL